MDDNNTAANQNSTALTTDIVSAFVSNNAVSAADLPGLISSVYASITGLTVSAKLEAENPVPPVSINKSVTPDYLISLEDGRQYKSLRRHLRGKGLTPAEYREKWGLPHDYPMVAPTYAAQRSALAKSMGLGRKHANPDAQSRAIRRRKAA